MRKPAEMREEKRKGGKKGEEDGIRAMGERRRTGEWATCFVAVSIATRPSASVAYASCLSDGHGCNAVMHPPDVAERVAERIASTMPPAASAAVCCSAQSQFAARPLQLTGPASITPSGKLMARGSSSSVCSTTEAERKLERDGQTKMHAWMATE
jgi:hypothetical protein